MTERYQGEKAGWSWKEKALIGGVLVAFAGAAVKSRLITTLGLIGIFGAIAGYTLFRAKNSGIDA